MDAKLLVALLFVINCYSSCGAALRRNPKVYNALITTDENLTSSRAYPVIQPTIHEQAHYPFGPYNPYGGVYSPPLVRFGKPIAPGFGPNDQLNYSYQFPPQLVPRPPPNSQPQPFPGYPPPLGPPTASAEPQPPSEEAPPKPTEQQQPIQPPPPPGNAQPNFMLPIPNNQPPQQMPNDKLPIPLNQFGFPPALIPLPQYPPQYPHSHRNSAPINLPPYGYNQYPLIYDPITGYRDQFLPPYDFYPSHAYATPPPKQQTTQPPATPPPAPTTAPTSEEIEEQSTEYEPTATEESPSFESIKNGSKSKNSAVPDVPPPPIPSGAKSKQS